MCVFLPICIYMPYSLVEITMLHVNVAEVCWSIGHVDDPVSVRACSCTCRSSVSWRHYLSKIQLIVSKFAHRVVVLLLIFLYFHIINIFGVYNTLKNVLRRHPASSTGCWQTFPHIAREMASMKWTWSHGDRRFVRLSMPANWLKARHLLVPWAKIARTLGKHKNFWRHRRPNHHWCGYLLWSYKRHSVLRMSGLLPASPWDLRHNQPRK